MLMKTYRTCQINAALIISRDDIISSQNDPLPDHLQPGFRGQGKSDPFNHLWDKKNIIARAPDVYLTRWLVRWIGLFKTSHYSILWMFKSVQTSKEIFQSGSGSNPPQKDIHDPPTTIVIWHFGDNARTCSQPDLTSMSMLQGRKKQNMRLRWKRVGGRAQLLNNLLVGATNVDVSSICFPVLLWTLGPAHKRETHPADIYPATWKRARPASQLSIGLGYQKLSDSQHWACSAKSSPKWSVVVRRNRASHPKAAPPDTPTITLNRLRSFSGNLKNIKNSRHHFTWQRVKRRNVDGHWTSSAHRKRDQRLNTTFQDQQPTTQTQLLPSWPSQILKLTQRDTN